MTAPHYLIIGNGAAGLSAAEIIRQRDRNGRITIVTNEPHLFYSRPGIAYVITGQVSEKQIISRTAAFYQEHRLDLRFGTVIRLEPAQQVAHLADGSKISYDALLLAVGSSAVPAPFPGRDLEGVLTFDTLDDARRVIRYAGRAKAAVIVGGGITAMELAEGMHHQGAHTHLLQRGDRLWPRLFDERESAIIGQHARQADIHLGYNEEIEEVLGKNGKVAAVRLKSGRELKCQVVGVAIGVKPNLELVQGLPVETDQGILVNEFMQSNPPTLFAAGDVAQVRDRWTGRHNLDVLWPSAINEGRAAGYNMVDVARGATPRYIYDKGSPFNAALLFGVHLTVIGRVGGQAEKDTAELAHLSRGSSNVWTAPFTTSYRSAWDKKGANSLRIVMAGGRLVGALLLGNQELADPLRLLIEQEVNLSAVQDTLMNANGNLPKVLLEAWRDWHQSWQ
ncbi:MAG: FAD-dependent oxidoreductase [Chloroflexi bacterium]|nr:FAD-dependent oxidoreductase [Chloroflexota bacterium]MCI0578544.1 FAD-dependent oxidoreductase [Chloroflexota bacterium]MCI0647460.1 FAD-dependent oxidoreductase [Chloroflexota bacterium]MCI0728740.1 FAD-dependent oxidoreductase [Chloroflexota bacterium]